MTKDDFRNFILMFYRLEIIDYNQSFEVWYALADKVADKIEG